MYFLYLCWKNVLLFVERTEDKFQKRLMYVKLIFEVIHPLL